MSHSMSPMSIILTVILLIVGYIALIRAVNQLSNQSYYSSRNNLIIDVVIGIMYLVLCGFVGLIYIYAGYDIMVIYAVLGLMVLVMLILFLKFCIQNAYDMSIPHVLLFLVYFGVVLYLTIFMRIGSIEDTSVLTTPFDDLQRAVVNGDPDMMQHMILNIIMFVPFGYLIPAMNPESLRHWSFAMLGGLMTSTVIEGVQMIFSIGQSDIDDVIANSLGAVIGYIVVRFVWQFQKNWEV